MFLAAVLLLSCTACSAPAKATETAPTTVPAATEPVSTVPTATVTEPTAEVKPEIDEAELPYDYQTADGLLCITLPNHHWGQLYTDEHDVLLSDGDCAIAVDLYRAKDFLPPIPNGIPKGHTSCCSTDAEWYNTSWVNFYPAGDGVWYCGGAVFYEYAPTPEPTAPSSEPTSSPEPLANWK